MPPFLNPDEDLIRQEDCFYTKEKGYQNGSSGGKLFRKIFATSCSHWKIEELNRTVYTTLFTDQFSMGQSKIKVNVGWITGERNFR